MKRFPPLLPTSYVWIGRQGMFKEDELAASPQDAPKIPDGLGHIGNCAQREGADNCINGAIPQGNMFPRKVQKLDFQARLFASPF